MSKRLALAAVTLMALVAVGCSTNPATSVDSTGATLNADGNCVKDMTMMWTYQIRDVSAGTGFTSVGPWRTAVCSNDSGNVALPEQRVGGLAPGHHHQFRMLAIWKKGTQDTAWFDANGTKNGTNYDSFTTPDVEQADASATVPERFIAPPDGEIISASSGCKVKEISNPRRMNAKPSGTHLMTIRLVTAWQYCPNGTIRKMYQAGADCSTTDAGRLAGWSCGPVSMIRAYNAGGSPNHGVYTYSYILNWQSPIWGFIKTQKRWCATNQISGSGAHRRHGSCEIQPW